LEEYKLRLKKSIETQKIAAMPFIVLATFDDLKIQQTSVQQYLEHYRVKPKFDNLEFLDRDQHKNKIKVAYFSPDFGQHAVSYLAVEMFELHDRSKFEIYAFSLYNHRSDSFKSRVVNSFDHFIDASTKSDEEVVDLAKSLGIDIAVDLCGITNNNRFNIFAKRVAPLQLSYLGYLGTMGGLVDYILADQVLIPEQNTKYYSEKIIYLPSYQINDRKKNNSDEIILRSDLGISSEAFVYASLNNSYKISPEIFSVWMDLLKEVENSVLLLSTPQDVIKENLLKEAQNHSVDSYRIIFLERVQREKYLSSFKLIDLFLDTPGYGAGTTASDALWMGVPVLTVQGNSMPARIASSVLNSFGMPELITNSLNDYKTLAIHLAQDRNEFNTLKNKTNSLIDKSLLFDSVKTTKHIEKAYQIIYQRRKDNLPVDHVVIVDES
jgi:predicted O-linked N-acetylglucosamine transferase (SPINDLY family)